MIGSLMYLTAFRPGIIYLKGQPKLGLWYPKDLPFELEAYSDSDYDGASLDRKSTTRGCQFLERRLISWKCKKQTIVVNSTTKAEYVAAANCCGQVLWIQNKMLDYGFNFMNTKIYIDNESTICIVKNPAKHIEYMVGDEAVHKELGDRMERAATTASRLEAEIGVDTARHKLNTASIKFQQSELESSPYPQCSNPQLKTQTSPPSMQTTHVVEKAATMPHDSPLPRVYSLGSNGGSMTLHELTVLYTTLSKKVKSLESDLKQTKLTYGAAYTKLIMKVKKLENRIKSSKARRRVRLIVSEDEDDLEDSSKRGRKIT
ncbi:hypothetical protein Tco_1020573 [Tanacetum coccineum]